MKEPLDEKARLELYSSVFNGRVGKLLLEDIMEHLGYNEDVFSSDPHMCAYNLGRLSAALWIKAQTEKQDVDE